MNKGHERQVRVVLGFIMIGAVVLLLGAGRIGDSMLSRHQAMQNAQREWQSAVRTILTCKESEITQDSRKMHRFAMEDPVLFLNTACGKMEQEQH